MITVCRKCGGLVYASSVEGYAYECRDCDEDFYSFEVAYFDDAACVDAYLRYRKQMEDECYAESTRGHRMREFAKRNGLKLYVAVLILQQGYTISKEED